MAQDDWAQVLLLSTRLGRYDGLNLSVNTVWDIAAQMHRIKVVDVITNNDAWRSVTNGRDEDGAVPVKSFVDVLPEMIEEIIVLNKLTGVNA